MHRCRVTDGPKVEINMVELSGEAVIDADEERIRREENQMKVAYPKANENLLDFLLRFPKKKLESLMCPRCSSMYDKKTTENLERV